jgi:hypothetical protein
VSSSTLAIAAAVSANTPIASVANENHDARSPVVEVVHAPSAVQLAKLLLVSGFAPGTSARRP